MFCGGVGVVILVVVTVILVVTGVGVCSYHCMREIVKFSVLIC